MTNKPGQKVGAKIPEPKKIRLPKWWAGLKLEARWKDLLAQLHEESPEQLRKRVMTQVSIIEHERAASARQEKAAWDNWQAEKQALQAKIGELEDRIRQGRQHNVFGMLNAITNCLESNSRAVHALAEPMQQVLGHLADEIAQDNKRHREFAIGRGWGKSFTQSGIPAQWPQPPQEGQK